MHDSLEPDIGRDSRSRSRAKRPLYIVQFVAGLAMLPLAVWFLLNGDIRGSVLTAVVAVVAIGYAGVNLFVRPWP